MHLEHFKKKEFRGWWQFMSPRLLVMLDVLRFQLGTPVFISSNVHSLGRNAGESESAHNVDRWNEVLAADVFVEGIYLRAQVEDVVDTARKLGFTGIGVYTDTENNRGKPQPMFHFDVRPNEKMGTPDTWGRINGQYVSIMKAIQDVSKEHHHEN